MPYLEINEVLLVHCNIVNNNYQQNSKVLYSFVRNKSFFELLDISPKKAIFLKTFDLEFLYIELWFTHQSSKPPELKDLIINLSIKYKKWQAIQFNKDIKFAKGYGFLSFARNVRKNW